MKILIVEDEFVTAMFLKQVLSQLGHEVVDSVDNAHSCIDALKRHSVDVVFMDININGPADGLQLALSLHMNYAIKIIFMTSYHDEETLKEAAYAMPVGFLVKPILKKDIEAIMMIAQTHITPHEIKKEYIDFGTYCYDTKSDIITCENRVLALSRLETKALKLLAENLNCVVDSKTLINQIWDGKASRTSLRELISRLRKKLPGVKLESHSNIGYILHQK